MTPFSNDLAAFKQSLTPISPIKCPSCGNELSAANHSSFEIRLNILVSEHLNCMIEMLRLYTLSLDFALRDKTSLPPLKAFGDLANVHNSLSAWRINQDISGNNANVDQGKDVTLQEIANQHNPLDSSGVFKDGPIAKHADHFYRIIDPDDVYDSIHNLPPLPSRSSASDAPAILKYADAILGHGLEPRSFGLLLDIITQQNKPHIPVAPMVSDLSSSRGTSVSIDEFWSMRDFFGDPNQMDCFEPTSREAVKTACPGIYGLLERIWALPDQAEPSSMPSGVHSISEVKSAAKRSLYLLLILHGHRFLSDSISTLDKGDKPDGGNRTKFANLFLRDRYSLPVAPNISLPLFYRFLKSRLLFSDCASQKLHEGTVQVVKSSSTGIENLIALIHEFFKKLKGGGTIPEWLNNIERIADVYCPGTTRIERKGPLEQTDVAPADLAGRNTAVDEVAPSAAPADTGGSETGRGRSSAQKRKTGQPDGQEDMVSKGITRPSSPQIDRRSRRTFQTCGWKVGDANCESVIVLGSQGVGKSTIFASGLDTLRMCSDSVGISMQPEDAETAEELLSYMQWPGGAGILPSNYPKSLRLEIDSSQDCLENPGGRFSFVDIPGEFVSSLIRGEDRHPQVPHLLRSSKSIVFCYDMWMDQHFRDLTTKFKDSNTNSLLEAVQTHTSAIETARSSKTGAKVCVDQKLLLDSIVKLTKAIGHELDRMKFVCLFPKIDLLKPNENESESEHRIVRMLNAFKQDKIVGEDYGSFGGLHCAAADAGLGQQNLLNRANHHLELARKVSDAFKNAIGQGDIRIFGNETADKLFWTRINQSVIKFSESAFGKDNCFFVPVSSFGWEAKQDSQRGIRPLLTEYAFLLPISLGLARNINSETSKKEG